MFNQEYKQKIATGAKAMPQDNNFDFPEFPVFDIAELKRDTEKGEICDEIDIDQKTIRSLGEIVAIADKHNMSLHIEECVLMEVQIDSANIDISFNDSIFEEKIHLKSGTFNGKLIFWDSIFGKEADFSDATFKADVSFEDCTFHKEVSFLGATFKTKATFKSCDFEGKIVFDNTLFEGEVDFSESTFRKKAMYTGATFKKQVDLCKTLFEESLEITGSNLPRMKKVALTDHQGHKQTLQRKSGQTPQFDLSHELDTVLKKKISRRQMLRSLFKFLPEDKEE